MAEDRPPPPARVPTLTEVVSVAVPPALAAVPPVAVQAPAPVPVDVIDEARLVAQVLSDLQPRIDLMFEYRVRETLAPVLATLTEAMVREVRDELARTLRDVVSRAVAQEVSRRKPR